MIYHYVVYLSRSSKKTEEVSKALGNIIEAMKGCHLEVREELTAFSTTKPLSKGKLKEMESSFTKKAKELWAESPDIIIDGVEIELATPEQELRIGKQEVKSAK